MNELRIIGGEDVNEADKHKLNVKRLFAEREKHEGTIPSRLRKKMVNRFDAQVAERGALDLDGCVRHQHEWRFEQRALANLLQGHEMDALNLLLLSWYVKTHTAEPERIVGGQP